MRSQGQLPPGAALEPRMPGGNGGTRPRCQWVMRPREGEEFGRQCSKFTCTGRPYCASHGGKNGRRPRTGADSKYNPVPQGLLRRFEAAQHDAQLLSLHDEIALVKAQIWSLSEGAAAQQTFTGKQAAELRRLLETFRGLVRQEMDLRIAMQSLLDVEQVLLLIGYIYQAVIRHVADPQAVRKVGAELRRLAEGFGTGGSLTSAAPPAEEEATLAPEPGLSG